MIGPIDKLITRILRRVMHKRREKVIEQKITDYLLTHQLDEASIIELNEKLQLEAMRIIAIVDESILSERIKRARYTFWVTAIIGTVVVVALASYPVTTSLAPFFAPLIAAFVAWAVSIGTIPISYIKRVQGAMDSAIVMFELERAKRAEKGEAPEPVNVEALQKTVLQLQAELAELRAEIRRQSDPKDTDNIPLSSAVTAFFRNRQKEESSEESTEEPIVYRRNSV